MGEASVTCSLLLLLLRLLHNKVTAAVVPGNTSSTSFTPVDSTHFWSSTPSGNFTFGFKLVDGGGYLLAIWRSLDANETAIWWADFGDVASDNTVKQGATLNYTSSHGALQLYDSTSSLVWQSGNYSTSTSLQFLDTGNLRLLQADNSSAAAWESFKDRRDSLMLTGLVASDFINKPFVLQSRRNQTSYGRGRYHMATYNRWDFYLFGIDELSKQYAYMKDYNVSLIISDDVVRVGNQLDSSGYLTTDSGSGKLSLDPDANLRVYEWAAATSTWVRVWELMQDSTLACRAQSPCGPFGLCTVAASSRINCTCPSGYAPISSEDPGKGCNSTRIPPVCGQRGSGNTTAIAFEEVQNADYYYNDLIWYESIYSVDECKKSCLSNCACIAATYNTGSLMCFLKGNRSMGYLENGLISPGSTILLMKLLQQSDMAEGLPSVKKGMHPGLIAAIVAATAAAAAGIGAFIFRSIRKQSSWFSDAEKKSNEAWDAGPRKFSYRELVEASSNFSDLLGEGGFGMVYKAHVRDTKGAASEPGMKVVAVKALKPDARNRRGESRAVKQFRAEAGTLSKIHHRNLVSLLGYCISGKRRLLVYEYMENGSLDRYLSPAHKKEPLPWRLRHSIAVGTARGIAYLHHDCVPRILHCDIKPQNVLLDEDFAPKVADFGLSSYIGEVNHDQRHLTVSKMRGTRGYMAPDWVKTDEITIKADVYSFGILLLELVHGLFPLADDSRWLVVWALQCLAEKALVPDHEVAGADEKGASHDANEQEEGDRAPAIALRQFVHNTYTEREESALEQQLRCLKVALWCVHQEPTLRPSMAQVLQQLEGIREIKDPPDPAAVNNRRPQLLGASASSSISKASYSYSVVSAR